MNGWRLTDDALKHGGVGLVAFAIALGLFLTIGPENGRARQLWRQYERWITNRCDALHVEVRGAALARAQLLLGVTTTLAALNISGFDPVPALGTAAMFAVAPYGFFSAAASRRREAMEKQISGWLQLLANALATSPALGQAIEATRPLVQPPMSQELDVVTKELELGTTVDEALRRMSTRIESRTLSAALSAALIGHRTGGDLVKMLNDSAKAFRELARLEGIVRSKTAQNRAQIVAMAAAPFVIAVMMTFYQEGHFEPMLNSTLGTIAIVGGFLCWVFGLLWARAILMVRV